MAITLPKSMRAIVIHGPGNGGIEHISVPQPRPGTVTVRILHSAMHKNFIRFYEGSSEVIRISKWPYVIGGHAVGRVAAVGPDTTAFKPGQLVVVDAFIRARDDPNVNVIWGAFEGLDDKTRQFYRENWLNSTWAEYARAPLENTWAIDEAKVIDGLGLRTQDLAQVGALAIVYAALRRINVRAGETVVIAPATGTLSSSAVHIARAMGVNVVAASRSATGLKELEASYPGIKTVQLRGNVQEDMAGVAVHGPIDAYIDISPPEATGSTHLEACTMAVRSGGRVCLMGGQADTSLPVPHMIMVMKQLTIRGSYMYEPKHVRELIAMIETGVLRLDKEAGIEVVGDYPLEEFKEALQACQATGRGKCMVLSS